MDKQRLEEYRQAIIEARKAQADLEAAMNKFVSIQSAEELKPLTDEDLAIIKRSQEAWDKVASYRIIK
jgi:hypothetical protein